MMDAVAQARHGVLAAHLKPGHKRDRLDQLADAVHDEGDLRPVPADARDPGDRRGDVVFSCFNQDQDLDTVDFGMPARRASARTACRRS